MAEIQGSKITCASTYDVSAYVMFTNLPLDETSDVVEPNIKGSTEKNPKRSRHREG